MASFTYSAVSQHPPYQRRKARAIVKLLAACQEKSTLSRHQLAQVVAIMTPEQWRLLAFTAGVAVADLPAKQEVLDMLRAKTPCSKTGQSPRRS